MTDRELFEQALEAFEWNFNTDLDNIPACEQWAKMLKVNIAALRERLAQPEQTVSMTEYKRLQDLVTSQGIRLMEYESAQPEQERIIDCPRCGHCCPQQPEQEPVIDKLGYVPPSDTSQERVAETEKQRHEQEPTVKHMMEWVEYLKRQSDHGQHLHIPSGMSAGTCWELAIELEQFISTTPQQRQWQGLNLFDKTLLRTTHAPMKPVYYDRVNDHSVCAEVVTDWDNFFAAIEAKLKEKNT